MPFGQLALASNEGKLDKRRGIITETYLIFSLQHETSNKEGFSKSPSSRCFLQTPGQLQVYLLLGA